MTQGTPKFGKVGRSADFLLRLIAAGVLFAMMALTLVDVVLRYGFNNSIQGAFEITELMLVVLIFAGIPLVSHSDQHVVVDIVPLAHGLKHVLAIFTQALCTVILGLITWLLWRKAGRVLVDNDVTSALHIPILPFIYVMCFLTLAAAVIHLWKLVALLRGRGSDETGSSQQQTM